MNCDIKQKPNRMKHLCIFIGVLAISYFSFSQNVLETGKKVKNYVSPEYNRNSITLVGLDFDENLSKEVYSKFSKLEVPDKFYDNPLQNRIISPGASRSSVSNSFNQLNEEQIANWLNKNKIGQQILSKWFNRQPDGSFNVEVLKERGLFNANDNDYIIASASKRGESSLMDMGLGLVNQTYAVVFDYNNILTMNQYYDKNEVEKEKRVMNGYRANLKSFLYKLNFNDSVAAVFFQNYWIGEDTNDKEERIKAFENAEFPFVFVSKQNNDITGTQYNEGQSLAPKKQKSTEELLETLVQTGLENTITDIENQNQEFRVKAMVSDISPISAKIGKKEGLKFDQRYFVFENQQRNNGTIFSRRIGVVKSMKVADNRNVTTGETQPSEFYQIAGGKVDNYGMFLEQHNDIGINLFLGATIGGLQGFTGRAEYYISKALGGSGTSGKGLTSFKIYIEGAYGENTYEISSLDYDFTFTRGSIGLSKDFYPVSFLHWGPFIGYGIESATLKDDPDSGKVATDFIEMGARIGINILYNVQLIGSANYYVMITSELRDENNEVIDDEFDYKDYFEGRMGPGVSLGLRIMF